MTITSGEQLGQPTVTASPSRRIVVILWPDKVVQMFVSAKPFLELTNGAEFALEVLGPIPGDDGKTYDVRLEERHEETTD